MEQIRLKNLKKLLNLKKINFFFFIFLKFFINLKRKKNFDFFFLIFEKDYNNKTVF